MALKRYLSHGTLEKPILAQMSGTDLKRRRLSDLDLESVWSLNSHKKVTDAQTGLVHRLLSSGEFADVEIHCQNRVWKCHRAILSQRCHFFKACLAHPFIMDDRDLCLAGAG